MELHQEMQVRKFVSTYYQTYTSVLDKIEPQIQEKGYTTHRVNFHDLYDAITNPLGTGLQSKVQDASQPIVSVHLVVEKDGEPIAYVQPTIHGVLLRVDEHIKGTTPKIALERAVKILADLDKSQVSEQEEVDFLNYRNHPIIRHM